MGACGCMWSSLINEFQLQSEGVDLPYHTISFLYLPTVGCKVGRIPQMSCSRGGRAKPTCGLYEWHTWRSSRKKPAENLGKSGHVNKLANQKQSILTRGMIENFLAHQQAPRLQGFVSSKEPGNQPKNFASKKQLLPAISANAGS